MRSYKRRKTEVSDLRNLSLASATFIMFMFLSMVTEARYERSESGFFVEPIITYEVGKGSIDYPSPLGKTDVEREGFGVGARLGFHIGEMFFVGLDGRYSIPKFKTQDSNESSRVSSNAYNIGPSVGVQTPIMGIRLWGTYLLDGQLDPSEFSNTLDIKLKKLDGYRLGIGAYFRFVSINLEYQNAKYGSLDLQNIGPFSGPSDITGLGLKDESYILSLSFPMAL